MVERGARALRGDGGGCIEARAAGGTVVEVMGRAMVERIHGALSCAPKPPGRNKVMRATSSRVANIGISTKLGRPASTVRSLEMNGDGSWRSGDEQVQRRRQRGAEGRSLVREPHPYHPGLLTLRMLATRVVDPTDANSSRPSRPGRALPRKRHSPSHIQLGYAIRRHRGSNADTQGVRWCGRTASDEICSRLTLDAQLHLRSSSLQLPTRA